VVNVALVALAGCRDDCQIHLCDPQKPRPTEPVECVSPQADPDQVVPDTCSTTDSYEPNGDMITAAAPDQRECAGSRDAVIGTRDDVDVFRTGACAVGVDVIVTSIGTSLRPKLTVSTTRPIRTCIIPTCVEGATNVYSCFEQGPGEPSEVETLTTRTATDFRGCCRMGAGTIAAAMDCPLSSETIDTFFWVEAGDAPACSEYSLSWSF